MRKQMKIKCTWNPDQEKNIIVKWNVWKTSWEDVVSLDISKHHFEPGNTELQKPIDAGYKFWTDMNVWMK